MTYTYRHKSTGRRCTIAGSQIVDTYKIAHVLSENGTLRLWYWPTFLRWHELISPVEVDGPPGPRQGRTPKIKRCACGSPAVEEMTLTTERGPAIYHLCAECAELERNA